MISQKIRNRQALVLFALSVGFSFIVLNRWLVVDAGIRSYGRVWQLYINYEDFGFIRRGLLGTLFSTTGLNSLFDNEYYFAIAIHGLAIVILAIIILIHIVNSRLKSTLLVATVFLSPALIIQSGYTTGSLDVFMLILLSLNILHVRNNLLFSLILMFGILTHELFIFTIPAQLVSYYMSLKSRGEESVGKKLTIPTIVVAVSVAVVSLFGGTDFPQSYVERIMAEKLPNAAWQHSLWSGYFEISKSVAENAVWSVYAFLKDTPHGMLFLITPLIYLFLVAIRLISYSESNLGKFFLFFSTLCPLLVGFLAADLYRWIGMSASVGLLLTLSVLERGIASNSKITFVLLPFSLLAPFGAAQIDRPFPAQQFIWERFF